MTITDATQDDEGTNVNVFESNSEGLVALFVNREDISSFAQLTPDEARTIASLLLNNAELAARRVSPAYSIQSAIHEATGQPIPPSGTSFLAEKLTAAGYRLVKGDDERRPITDEHGDELAEPLGVIAACLPYSGAGEDEAQAFLDHLHDAGFTVVYS
jgi:hypothetical protein